MNTLRMKRYKDIMWHEWDYCVLNSKNGTFLFFRDYMDYHKDRFEDFSWMFYYKNKLVALFPCTIKDNIAYSHGGLTYGGIVSTEDMTQTLMFDVFGEMVEEFYSQGVKDIIYKAVPYFYHSQPSHEDIFVLNTLGCYPYRRDVTTVIDLYCENEWSENHKRSIRKLPELETREAYSHEYPLFWKILEETLLRNYDRKPVHSIEEIVLLSTKFPSNIKLYVALREERIIAGIVNYWNRGVNHFQYTGTTQEGRECWAVGKLTDTIIEFAKCNEDRYLDFGISTEWEDGKSILNKDLIQFKEGFGGGSATYDFYHMPIKHD